MSALVSTFKANLVLAAKMAYNRHLIRSKCPRGTTLRNEGININTITDLLGKVPSAISMTRRSPIRKGMIYAPQRGVLTYTVPMASEYMRRVMPTLIL